jgi:tRNA1Val (adenine37-N6)-methyltransferase
VAELASTSSRGSESARENARGSETRDTLFGGSLSIRQPARRSGYRVNVDALLLAAFAARVLEGGVPSGASSRVRHAVDLGAGVGAVGLSLLHLGAAARVTMIEIDAALASFAFANAEENEWSDRVDVIRSSVTDAAKPLADKADLVVCNPPYVPPGRGRAPTERVRTAKYGDLDVFLDAARKIAGRRARVSFVYPAIEATTLLAAFRHRGLEPKRLRAVHGRAQDKARIVLVECAPAKPGGLVIEPPLVEMEGRSRSSAIATLLSTPRR